MQCQDCKGNGISLLNKVGLIFELGVRCSKCGAEYRLQKGLAFIISFLVKIAVFFPPFMHFCTWRHT